MTGSRHKGIRRWFRGIVISIVCAMMMPSCAVPVSADVATDYLSVRVGYLGMELDEYTLAGKYHWSELQKNLPVYEIPYSYYQSGKTKKEYRAIVDSGRGFLVSDILSYAHIYIGDVKNLKFYVEDHKGIQAAFDKGALFKSRYYFDDLAGHRKIEYDDKHHIVGYSFDEAWNFNEEVDPMLALEDNWETFNEEFEHIGPNFDSLSTSSRFRLLFGQTSPTETLTSSSAKYVSCVYVTLNGQPKVGKMPKLKGSYGSHTMEMTVSTDNESIRDALSDLLKLNSTNKDVLVITGVKVTNDSGYSDMATVRVSYDIVGEGDASISVGFGSDSNSIASSAVVHGEAKSQEQADQEEDTNKEDTNKEKAKDDGKLTANAGNKNSSSGELAKSKSGKTENIEAKEAKAKTTTYVLSKDAQQKLEDMLNSQTEIAPAEEVTEVKQEEDKSKDRQKKLLLYTCLGGIGLCGLGGAAEFVSFRIRLNRRIHFRKV